jgi:biopolymer transport protein TolQ
MVVPLFFVASVKDLVSSSGPVAQAVLLVLLCFSLFSWTLIVSKWNHFSKARKQSDRFLAAFRKGPRAFELGAVLDQFYPSPLCKVFEYGINELSQQAGGGGKIKNPIAIQRALQIGASEESGRLESKLSWLATTASVTPFIGLFGTVWGIMDAFQEIAQLASARAAAPGIAEALITTAAGLATAIPAVIFYNMFIHSIRDFGSRMENFALEFQNLAERHYS